jgi:hypothetical protein
MPDSSKLPRSRQRRNAQPMIGNLPIAVPEPWTRVPGWGMEPAPTAGLFPKCLTPGFVAAGQAGKPTRNPSQHTSTRASCSARTLHIRAHRGGTYDVEHYIASGPGEVFLKPTGSKGLTDLESWTWNDIHLRSPMLYMPLVAHAPVKFPSQNSHDSYS